MNEDEPTPIDALTSRGGGRRTRLAVAAVAATGALFAGGIAVAAGAARSTPDPTRVEVDDNAEVADVTVPTDSTAPTVTVPDDQGTDPGDVADDVTDDHGGTRPDGVSDDPADEVDDHGGDRPDAVSGDVADDVDDDRGDDPTEAADDQDDDDHSEAPRVTVPRGGGESSGRGESGDD